MKKQFKLGIIGCGEMATSILRGVVLSDFIRERKIIVSDISEEKLAAVNYLGVNTVTDNAYAADNCEYLIIAVKRQDFLTVAQSLKDCVPKKVISVISGVSKGEIRKALNSATVKIARCVPNLACSIGSGALGLDMSEFNDDIDDTEFISNIFDCLGTVISVDEEELEAVYGVSACGSAYAFMFMDAMIEAGAKLGLSKSQSKILAVQTVLGAAEMAQREEKSLPQLLKANCDATHSIEAVKVFEDKKFSEIISCAAQACVDKLKKA